MYFQVFKCLWIVLGPFIFVDAEYEFHFQNVLNYYLKPVVICQLTQFLSKMMKKKQDILTFNKITFTFIVAKQTIPTLEQKLFENLY